MKGVYVVVLGVLGVLAQTKSRYEISRKSTVSNKIGQKKVCEISSLSGKSDI